MPLNIEEISPEKNEPQQPEQLNNVDNDGNKGEVDENLRKGEREGESNNNSQEQDLKPTLDNNVENKKRWSDEKIHSEDGTHEIRSNINKDNDKDAASSADESDFSLPKHRKDYPSDDDERSDSEQLSNDETGSEDSDDCQPPSKVYVSYEQFTSNNNLQVNGVNVPFEAPLMSLGNEPSQDDDPDVSRIVNPIIRSIADLKLELHTQFAKLHYYPDHNLDGIDENCENWQHSKFEESQDQDQYRYDAIITAKKLLDAIIPMQIPEEAKECLTKAHQILSEKSLLYHATENISSSTSQAACDVTTSDNKSGNANNNNKSSEENVKTESSGECSNQPSVKIDAKSEGQKSTVVDDTTTTTSKYQRDSTQGRKLRRHLTRGASAYSSSKSSRRNQNYSPRSNVRSPRIGSVVTSSIAGSATQVNNRRFVGFLPSRCFTCGGIGHFANNCSNKGSYISTSTSNSQQLSHSRRRPNSSRYRRELVNNSASNE